MTRDWRQGIFIFTFAVLAIFSPWCAGCEDDMSRHLTNNLLHVVLKILLSCCVEIKKVQRNEDSTVP